MQSLILQLNQAMADIRHSNGRIEARLEHGDSLHRHLIARMDHQDQKLDEINGRVMIVEQKQSKAGGQTPKLYVHAKHIQETVIPALKDAWPFLAMAAAGLARYLGYDLAGIAGP